MQDDASISGPSDDDVAGGSATMAADITADESAVTTDDATDDAVAVERDASADVTAGTTGSTTATAVAAQPAPTKKRLENAIRVGRKPNGVPKSTTGDCDLVPTRRKPAPRAGRRMGRGLIGTCDLRRAVLVTLLTMDRKTTAPTR